jgi:deazaflavin-dependent oxidoreductase (nitroreductase family)
VRNLAAVPVVLSRRVAAFNRRFNNPIQLSYAWLVPPWVVICHRGRRSGRRYRTPVNAYRSGPTRSTLAVVVLYGEQSDWIKNVLAGGGEVVRAGRTYELRAPRIVDPASANGISTIARQLGRISGKLLVAELGEPRPGFGRGPAAP